MGDVLDLDDDDGYFECGNLPKRHHRPQAAFEIWRADTHSFRTRLSEALYTFDITNAGRSTKGAEICCRAQRNPTDEGKHLALWGTRSR